MKTPKRARITVRVEDELKQFLSKRSEKKRVDESDVIREALWRLFEEESVEIAA